MTATTILVHGRGQQFQDPESLEVQWQDSFFRGLALGGVVHPPPRERVLFPFYGDLYQEYALAARRALTAQEERDRLAFERAVASAIQWKLASRGKVPLPPTPEPPIAEGLFDPVLELLDRVPGFSRGFVRLVMRDIYDYLTNKCGLRERTMERVFEPIERAQDEKVIIIAHSLGSIVTYDLLNTHHQVQVELYVTLGSPLGIDGAVRNRLLADASGRRDVPPGIKAWVNFADPDDLVALDGSLEDDFKKNGASFVRDLGIENPRGEGRSPHDSNGYLGQELLGIEVGKALDRAM